MILLLGKYTFVLLLALFVNRLGFGSAAVRHTLSTLALFSLPMLWLLEFVVPQ